jgi:hypothetical protein
MNEIHSTSRLGENSNDVYETCANIRHIGRSISIDLSDANIANCEVNDPHITIFFRKSPPWSNEELACVQNKRDQFVETRNLSNLHFTLAEWGPNAKLIEGSEMREFMTDIGRVFPQWRNDRPLHTTLCVSRKSVKGGRRL